jgi:hypothetical protein
MDMIKKGGRGESAGTTGRSRRSGAGWVAMALLVLGAGAAAQTASQPTAEAILDGYAAKAGGREVFLGIGNRRTTAVLKMAMMPAPGEVTSVTTKAGPYRVVVETPGFGRIEYGFDGRTVWEINPVSGPRIWEGPAGQRFKVLYGLDLLIRWRDVFKKVERAGLEPVGGKPAYKIRALTLEDFPVSYYFDQASGLLIKIEYALELATGPSLSTVLLSDYRPAGGILFPFTQVRREAGREMTLTFKSVEFNIEIPGEDFALPEPIQKLLKAGQ